jgi:hypothetical protein
LPSFDIEYIFLNIRAKSAGENLDIIYTCDDDGVTKVPLTIFIDEIKVQKDPEHSRDIVLQDNLILRMKYPSLKQFVETRFDIRESEESEELSSSEKIDKSFKIIASSMDVIFNNEESYAASDCEPVELFNFLDDLTIKQLGKIENFFATMPVLKHTVVIENPKTKVKNTLTLEGLTSFFTL